MESYDIDEIKDRLTVPEVLAKHGIECANPSKPILSPLRSEKTPSFSIYEDGKKWKDFGSGDQGDVFDLEEALAGCSKHEAIASLARVANVSPTDGLDPSGSPLSSIPAPRRSSAASGLCEEVSLAKLRSLRVNLRAVMHGEIKGSAMESLAWIKDPEDLLYLLRKGWLGADHSGRLAYLYRRGFKVRGDPSSSRGDRWVLGKSKSNAFASFADKDLTDVRRKGVILCEGESDTMAAMLEFRDKPIKVMGCLSSTIMPPDEILYPMIRNAEKVVIAFDGDDAGQAGSDRMAEHLKQEKFARLIGNVITLRPDDGDDLKKIYLRGELRDFFAR